MKIPRPPHNWSVTPAQAIAIQKRLTLSVEHIKIHKKVRLAAGVDAAFSYDNEQCIGGVVLWDVRKKSIIEQHTAVRKLQFPYVPGLLTFREAPAIIAALRKLHHIPDVLICDGQGIAHPRRLGIASHLGVITGIPTIGCAKSRLVGTYQDPGPSRGSKAPLLDKDEIIGTVLRTRDKVRVVFISVGHKIDLPTAEQLVLECAIGYRLPEPTRLADHLVAAAKRKNHSKQPHTASG